MSKPKAKLVGSDGNIFNLAGIASQALRRAGQAAQATEMQTKIFSAGSYEEALCIIMEYVDDESMSGPSDYEDHTDESGDEVTAVGWIDEGKMEEADPDGINPVPISACGVVLAIFNGGEFNQANAYVSGMGRRPMERDRDGRVLAIFDYNTKTKCITGY